MKRISLCLILTALRLVQAHSVFSAHESGALISLEHTSQFADHWNWNPAYAVGVQAIKAFPTGSLDIGLSTAWTRMQPPSLGADAWGHSYATSLVWDVKP